jgi:hypothetical protein
VAFEAEAVLCDGLILHEVQVEVERPFSTFREARFTVVCFMGSTQKNKQEHID